MSVSKMMPRLVGERRSRECHQDCEKHDDSHNALSASLSAGESRCLFRRLQPAQRDEELVGFGQRFLFELIAVEEAMFLAVEAVQFRTVRLTIRPVG